MGESARTIDGCQVCGRAGLESLLFLGYMRPGNMMDPIGESPEPQELYPLEFLRCPACTLVQIGLEVDGRILFPPDFPYRTGNTRALVENFKQLFVEVRSLIDLRDDDLIADIGSNDGTLLKNFAEAGYPVLGIEPSKAAQDAEAQGIPTEMRFFDRDLVNELKDEGKRPRIITCTNTFAHMTEIVERVRALADLLPEEGVFVSESHYLLELVRSLQYDTIYHEHLRYYSVRSLIHLLDMADLEVFYVSRIPTHGGSIRVYAGHRGNRTPHASVEETLEEEDGYGLTDGSALKTFRDRVVESKAGLWELLGGIKANGSTIYGIGAAVRAATLIGYTGVDDSILDCILEVGSSDKIGKYMPGTRIPVLDEIKLFEAQPDYALLLSWHLADYLATGLRERGFTGRFIAPLPQPRVLDL